MLLCSGFKIHFHALVARWFLLVLPVFVGDTETKNELEGPIFSQSLCIAQYNLISKCFFMCYPS